MNPSRRICRSLALVWAVFCLTLGRGFAAESQPAKVPKQTDVIIVHVDKYGVYVPNRVFYWDTTMSKQKISQLTQTAERLRNKNATILYLAEEGTPEGDRPVIVDLFPVREPPEAGLRSALSDVPFQQAHTEPGGSAAPAPSGTFTRAQIEQFIQQCMRAVQIKDLKATLTCYGDRVDYYAQGNVDLEYIKADKTYYFRHWDSIRSELDSHIVIIVTDQPNERIAKFISHFYVENRNKAFEGRAENIWTLERIDGRLKIVGEKQRIIESQSRAPRSPY